MERVVLLVGTRHGGRFRPAGTELEVPANVAERWEFHGIAARQYLGDQEGTPLPDDFPASDELRAAGFLTVDAVVAASDRQLLAIPNVGKATVREIRRILEG